MASPRGTIFLRVFLRVLFGLFVCFSLQEKKPELDSKASPVIRIHIVSFVYSLLHVISFRSVGFCGSIMPQVLSILLGHAAGSINILFTWLLA